GIRSRPAVSLAAPIRTIVGASMPLIGLIATRHLRSARAYRDISGQRAEPDGIRASGPAAAGRCGDRSPGRRPATADRDGAWGGGSGWCLAAASGRWRDATASRRRLTVAADRHPDGRRTGASAPYPGAAWGPCRGAAWDPYPHAASDPYPDPSRYAAADPDRP